MMVLVCSSRLVAWPLLWAEIILAEELYTNSVSSRGTENTRK